MEKDKVSPEEKEDTPKMDQVDIPALMECAKTFLPSMGLTAPKQNSPELCELHIVGTPEMIQKILKID